MIYPPVFTHLSASSAVTAIVGNRIYRHGDGVQDGARPYLTFYASIAPENTLSELPAIDRCSVTVDCWSPDDAQVEALFTAVRDAIEPHAHLISVPIDNRDRKDTKLFRISLQFDYWHPRST